jgi:hypothetical protein
MNTQELRALMQSIERAIALIGEKPSETEFDKQVFDELSQMRDVLRQTHPELFDLDLDLDRK